MTKYWFIFLGNVILLCLISVTPKDLAQETIKIDPEAAKILSKVADTYSNLKSFQAFSSKKVAVKTGKKIDKITYPLKLIFEKPNKFILEGLEVMRDLPTNLLIMSNGKTLWVYNKDEKIYQEEPAPSSLKELREAMYLRRFPENLALSLILSENPFQTLTGEPGEVKLTGKGKVGSVICYIIQLNRYKAQGSQLKLYVGEKDYLIYKLEALIRGPGGRVEMAETYSQVRLNAKIPSDWFVFKPPKGIVNVKDLPRTPGMFGPPPFMKGKRVESKLLDQPAPSFELKDLEGDSISLNEFLDKPILVFFFASWSPPCLGMLSQIQKIYQDLSSKGLVVIGISSEKDIDRLKEIVREKGIKFPILTDPEGQVAKLYQVEPIPRIVIINKEGKVQADFIGVQSEAELREELKKLGRE